MPNEIYHRSEWGNPKAEGFGDVYFDAAATNKLYNHSDNYENSDGTDKILRDIPNKASIVLTPTAYSDGSLNTVIPTDGNGDFNFSRGSSATRVNEQGLVEDVQILSGELVQNGNFDTDSDWSKDSGWSIEDGKAIALNTLNRISQSFSTTTSSVYKVTFTVLDYVSGDIKVQFTGGTTVNSDWYNDNGTFIVYLTALSGNNLLAFKGRNGAEFTGSIDNISAVEVTDDTDLPRIDFTDGTGSLLLEPSRTNVIPYSQDFSNSAWTKERATISANTNTSPDGSVNASKIIENTANGSHSIYEGVAISNNIYTFSCFVKKSDRDYCFLQIITNLGRYTAVFDLVNGVVTDTQTFSSPTNTSNKIEDYGNGWYRVSVTSSNTASTTGFFQVGLSNSANPSYSGLKQPTYTGDGSSSVQIWGAQVEAGNYPTSYIVSNSGSTTTRSADVANNSGNADLFNDSEGVLYAEIASLVGDEDGSFYTDARVLSISNGTANEYIEISLRANKIRFQSVSASGGLVKDVVIDRDGEFDKLAIQYKSNDYKIYINGVSQTITQTTGTPSGLNSLQFEYSGGGLNFYGKVKSLAVFKEALTDEELQALTT
jgi:hypothetical protein